MIEEGGVENNTGKNGDKQSKQVSHGGTSMINDDIPSKEGAGSFGAFFMMMLFISFIIGLVGLRIFVIPLVALEVGLNLDYSEQSFIEFVFYGLGLMFACFSIVFFIKFLSSFFKVKISL